MALLLSITSGWTGRLGPFTLRVDGNPLALTGLTVELILTRWGTSVSFTGGGTVIPDPDQVTNKGQVSYDPIASDFTWTAGVVPQQNYQVHWKVTDVNGKIVSFPNGAPDQIAVYRL